MESLFEFLFKYPPLFYERGELVFSASWPVRTVVVAAAALTAAALLTYLRRNGRAGRIDRAVLAAHRLALLAVLTLCLLQPALALTSTVPERNFVGVLLDDSRSMTIVDGEDERPRSDFVREQLEAPDAPLRSALADRFAVRFFRFGEEAGRLDEPASLAFADADTRLAPGLDVVREELRGVPLAGIVVVSDGGAADEDLRDALLRLRAAEVPVYAVGTGTEALAPDVEVSRVEMPSGAALGSTIAVDVVVAHRGYGGRTVPLRVEEEGQRVAERSVELPADGGPATERLHVRLESPGPRRFRVVVPPLDDEVVTRNNARELLTSVEDGRRKLLYVEGRPRFEVGFLRRAVRDDEQLQVVVLQRTAEEKFLRLSVDDADELAGGFPTSREELFGYRGLILGSVEAGFFTPDQLRMISEFVSERGGSLLMLGGRDAFAEGGWAGTPVADALPVVLDGTRPIGGRTFFAELDVRPTAAGRSHAALQLGGSGEEADGPASWTSLPPLSSLNPVREVKAGATPLLVGVDDAADDELVVLAWQRYGRGKSLALPVQDTWMWQMHADLPVDDPTHATFWRQLLRWMVDGVPDRVAVRSGSDPVEPGRPAELAVEVLDSTFLGVNDARVSARIEGPDGEVREIGLGWSGEEDGVYRGRFLPAAEGLHRVEATVEHGGGSAAATAWLRSAESDREFFDAGLEGDRLRRIARETGGRFYRASEADRLARDLEYTGAGVTLVEERDLWDMPAVFLLVVLLAATEWSYRRWRGLA